jgi:hypothetical protein
LRSSCHTGHFLTADPCEDIAAVIPYAVNWRIKERLGDKVEAGWVNCGRNGPIARNG